MKNNYDFSKGVKNPYTDKLKNGYSITVHYDFKQNNTEEVKKDNDIEKNQKQA